MGSALLQCLISLQTSQLRNDLQFQYLLLMESDGYRLEL